jgi:hypothetical protein
MAEGEVQSRGIDSRPSGQGMFVVQLQVLHGQKIAVAQGYSPSFSGGAVSDFEVPLGAQAHRGNNGGVDFPFIVPVPTHGVLSIAVEVAQYGVELPAL